jgi:hypothetical protein
VESMCNSPGGLLPSTQIESHWGFESSAIGGGGSPNCGYGEDASSSLARQAILHPRHQFYSSNLFNGV